MITSTPNPVRLATAIFALNAATQNAELTDAEVDECSSLIYKAFVKHDDSCNFTSECGCDISDSLPPIMNSLLGILDFIEMHRATN